ncbi:MAG: OsmC family protein [Candidatus Delongbacteria bacterium]
MSEYEMEVVWARDGAVFSDNRYSRRHRWQFDGGVDVPASSSPHLVPVLLSEVAAVDPEEAFVASLASCHMLWLLSIAAARGYIVDSYRDRAVGVMGKAASGNAAMLSVTLHPMVDFVGERLPTKEQIIALHEEAHSQCYIANSVKTDVRCEPVVPAAGELS